MCISIFAQICSFLDARSSLTLTAVKRAESAITTAVKLAAIHFRESFEVGWLRPDRIGSVPKERNHSSADLRFASWDIRRDDWWLPQDQ
jgi:hypothetical protein